MAARRRGRLASVDEVAIRLRIKRLKGGVYLATSPDVPGLVAEGRSIAEAVELSQRLARQMVEVWVEHGDPLPPIFAKARRSLHELLVPVGMP
jgi:antitoxin HicB